MYTLLFRLVGPMQSWGSRSRFDDRDTHLEPTKSAVIGLICAALGRDRSQPVDDLASLRMGIRIDSPGRVATDFHTANFVARASGSGIQETVTSHRHYIADARFWVGLESDDRDVLQMIADALTNPKWLLSLGRKSFPLSCTPIPAHGELSGFEPLQNALLEGALKSAPWLRARQSAESPKRARLMLESPDGTFVMQDQPISFQARSFTQRRLIICEADLESPNVMNLY